MSGSVSGKVACLLLVKSQGEDQGAGSTSCSCRERKGAGEQTGEQNDALLSLVRSGISIPLLKGTPSSSLHEDLRIGFVRENAAITCHQLATKSEVQKRFLRNEVCWSKLVLQKELSKQQTAEKQSIRERSPS